MTDKEKGEFKINFLELTQSKLGSFCCSIGRAVTSKTKGLQFESSQREIIYKKHNYVKVLDLFSLSFQHMVSQAQFAQNIEITSNIF